MTAIPPEPRALLESDSLAHLVTLNADGSLQISVEEGGAPELLQQA
ncbi:MAG TPA: hypothetical protein VNT58_08330 [Gaiellaceae bacterium]|nr:hypothetical protein [Gaiellaceae bacterium]